MYYKYVFFNIKGTFKFMPSSLEDINPKGKKEHGRSATPKVSV